MFDGPKQNEPDEDDTEPSDSHRDNEVIEELRRGYRLGERLLRPAMVKVASRG